MKTPPELDRIVDQVLAYRPAPKTKAAKRRAKRIHSLAMATPVQASRTWILFDVLQSEEIRA